MSEDNKFNSISLIFSKNLINKMRVLQSECYPSRVEANLQKNLMASDIFKDCHRLAEMKVSPASLLANVEWLTVNFGPLDQYVGKDEVGLIGMSAPTWKSLMSTVSQAISHLEATKQSSDLLTQESLGFRWATAARSAEAILFAIEAALSLRKHQLRTGCKVERVAIGNRGNSIQVVNATGRVLATGEDVKETVALAKKADLSLTPIHEITFDEFREMTTIVQVRETHQHDKKYHHYSSAMDKDRFHSFALRVASQPDLALKPADPIPGNKAEKGLLRTLAKKALREIGKVASVTAAEPSYKAEEMSVKLLHAPLKDGYNSQFFPGVGHLLLVDQYSTKETVALLQASLYRAQLEMALNRGFTVRQQILNAAGLSKDKDLDTARQSFDAVRPAF